ncbi:lactosylceramide 4-alpha-galactosyltransferase isoform X2 [Sciurus carolinensis]|uniref:lactosylceramide 4-alpha-galactosyltransferase isoform X2 n=1 Tax=Sciurus carolinensis TaxID=30640 RepID=UPI001FB4BAD6|nr:lactosylceramide 4-alpha-galactosyltransferase isoform X2 [Sciurus carolinensis]
MMLGADGLAGAKSVWKGRGPIVREGQLLSRACLQEACRPHGSPPLHSGLPRLTGQFPREAPWVIGETMSKSPDCLPRLLRATPRQRVCTLFIIGFKFTFFLSVMIYWHIVGEPKDRGQLYNLPVDVPCPPLGPRAPSSSTPAPGHIFFLETSDRTNPNFLFMCSVESAARTHPESRVAVLMKGLPGGHAPLPRHLGLSLLSCFPNVQVLPLDLEGLFRDTPLAAWYRASRWRWEPYLLPVLSDAARIALLWKFGGIYLDTDFIVLKNLRNLTNVLGTQSRYVLNGAFLAFEPRHEFLALCMHDFVAHYNGWIWGHQGPQLLTRVFKKWCSIRSLQESHTCRGVTALPREAFYPIAWQNWKKYFEEVRPEELPQLLNATYAVHVWNKKSQGTHFEATSRALLAQLHARYCPTTHKVMKMYL